MKTRIALYCYYLSISLLTTCALVIVAKLMLWPPCTQTGNTCVIEPWSVAGLAGTVLAVAATVLAILGAVAVAAWWTSLNDRVNEQVQKLYKAQSEEANTRIDYLLVTLEARVNTQLEEFQQTFDQLNTETDKLKNSLQVVFESTKFLFSEQKRGDEFDGKILKLLTEILESAKRGELVATSPDKNNTQANSQHEE